MADLNVKTLPLVGFFNVDPHLPEDVREIYEPTYMWEIVHALDATSAALDRADAHKDPGETGGLACAVRVLVKLLVARETGDNVQRLKSTRSRVKRRVASLAERETVAND